MRTRSQSRNSNRQQQQVNPTFVEPFNLVEPIENQAPPVVTMDDNRTMAQLLEAPTEGYEDAIVVPEITADNFELKHGLLTLVQNKQFFRHDKEDPHAHIRYFNKITSTMKFPNVPIPPTNNETTKDVQPLVVQLPSHVPNSEPVVAPVSAPMPNPKPSIPYPSRRNDERCHEKANDQIEKFYEIFKDLSFEISLTDASILMPKFASTLKDLIRNKEKLSEMDRTPLNEHFSAVLLKNLHKKLRDPSKFLIPCDFPGMDECLALVDLGASINLMPLSVERKNSCITLPELTTYLLDTRTCEPFVLPTDIVVSRRCRRKSKEVSNSRRLCSRRL
ncbi:hypothetical protein Tco_0516309 [Tanacetum coccineum]